jgi:hypothetical protein
MKIKIWPEDATIRQMDDWLAELRNDGRAQPGDDGRAQPGDDGRAQPRDDGRAESGDDGRAEPSSGEGPRPEAPVATAANWPPARAETGTHAETWGPARAGAFAGAGAPAETDASARASAFARAGASTSAGALAGAGGPASAGALARAGTPASGHRASAPVRAVIGDELRMPIMWCEMGSCISWYSHPAALGEADTRARAIDAGWRIDALGRLACPQCQQTDPGFWSSSTVVLWDRYTAIARTARITGMPGDGTSASSAGISRDLGYAVTGYPAASPTEPRWQQNYPAAMSAGWRADRPWG